MESGDLSELKSNPPCHNCEIGWGSTILLGHNRTVKVRDKWDI